MTTKPRQAPKTEPTIEQSRPPVSCVVDNCPDTEFEPGAGLCGPHFTTRLDLREAARHG